MFGRAQSVWKDKKCLEGQQHSEGHVSTLIEKITPLFKKFYFLSDSAENLELQIGIWVSKSEFGKIETLGAIFLASTKENFCQFF